MQETRAKINQSRILTKFHYEHSKQVEKLLYGSYMYFILKRTNMEKKSILIQAAFKEVVAVYYICMITNSMILWVIIQIIGLGHTPVYK